MLKRKLLRAARLTEDRVRQLLRLNQSESTLAKDAQGFWTRPITEGNSFWWHSRKSTPFADAEDKWLSIGRRHVKQFVDLAQLVGVKRPVDKAVDWGCGAGANALSFASECKELWGVDVSPDALRECQRELEEQKSSCVFHPVRIEIPTPETALKEIPRDIDLFFSYYVFEVFHSKDYGARILRLAHDLLKPGGLCIIQVKYETDSWQTRARRWGYTRGAANMTTYRVEEFWELAEVAGLEPRYVTLVPKPPEVPDVRYAYFMLQKPPINSAETAPSRPALLSP